MKLRFRPTRTFPAEKPPAARWSRRPARQSMATRVGERRWYTVTHGCGARSGRPRGGRNPGPPSRRSAGCPPPPSALWQRPVCRWASRCAERRRSCRSGIRRGTGRTRCWRRHRWVPFFHDRRSQRAADVRTHQCNVIQIGGQDDRRNVNDGILRASSGAPLVYWVPDSQKRVSDSHRKYPLTSNLQGDRVALNSLHA